MIVSGIFRINPEMSRCVTQKHSYQILNGPTANWDDFYHVNVEKRPKHLDKCSHVFVLRKSMILVGFRFILQKSSIGCWQYKSITCAIWI